MQKKRRNTCQKPENGETACRRREEIHAKSLKTGERHAEEKKKYMLKAWKQGKDM